MTPYRGVYRVTPLALNYYDHEDGDLLDRWGVERSHAARTSPQSRQLVLIGRIQRRLEIVADGKWGPRTEQAVKDSRLENLTGLARLYAFTPEEWVMIDKLRKELSSEIDELLHGLGKGE